MTRLFEAKPFVIAEVGSNWLIRSDCLESIEVAKECGADAVKFQAFTHEALYGSPGEMPHALPLDWLPTLKARAEKVGIEFMCTAFSPELVAAVDPFVEVHKVASSDAAWPQMLEAVARTMKPALVSMGAKTAKVLGEIEDRMHEEYVSMYCVAAYPADFVDFEIMDRFKGFSDHTLGYSATVEAARRGAIVIEKHFTAFPDLDTPDRPHSLTPAQFTRMVDIIRGRAVQSEEQAMYLRHNRRLVATRDIRKGDELSYGYNYGAYRSLVDDSRGLSPFRWVDVEERCTTREIKQGEAIGEGDFA